MVSTIEDDEKLITTLKLQGDTQSRPHTFLTEDGLYEVLMQSRKPIAKQFKKTSKDNNPNKEKRLKVNFN